MNQHDVSLFEVKPGFLGMRWVASSHGYTIIANMAAKLSSEHIDRVYIVYVDGDEVCRVRNGHVFKTQKE